MMSFFGTPKTYRPRIQRNPELPTQSTWRPARPWASIVPTKGVWPGVALPPTSTTPSPEVNRFGEPYPVGNPITPAGETFQRLSAAPAPSLAASTEAYAPVAPAEDRQVSASWGPLAWVLPVVTTLLGGALNKKPKQQAETALEQQGAMTEMGLEQLKAYYLPLLAQIQEFLGQWNDPTRRNALYAGAEGAALPILQQALGRIGTEFTRRGEGASSFEGLARGSAVGDWARGLADFRRQQVVSAPEEFMKRAQWLLDAVRGIYQPLQGLGAQYGQQASTYSAQQAQGLQALMNLLAALQKRAGSSGGMTMPISTNPNPYANIVDIVNQPSTLPGMTGGM